ncbi:hypothetical protein BJX96DRAFT_172144 [Aspergillus floccosus]
MQSRWWSVPVEESMAALAALRNEGTTDVRAETRLHVARAGAWIRVEGLTPGMPAIVLIPGAWLEARVLENVWDAELTNGNLMGIEEILKAFPVAEARYLRAAQKLTGN